MNDDLMLLTDDLTRSEADPSRLVIRLVKYGEVANTPQGRETFTRTAFDGVDITKVHLESQRHDGSIVGIGEAIEQRDDGPYGVFRVSDTADGRDLLTLVKDGVLRAASVVFRPLQTGRRMDGVLERKAVDLRRVAVLPRGAYMGAAVTEMRNEMTDIETTAQVVADDPAPEPVDLAPVLKRMDSMDEAIRRVDAATKNIAPGDSPSKLLAYRNFGEALLNAARDADVRDELERALEDQITADNPGLILPGNYIGRIIQPVSLGRRAVGAFGGPAPLPEKGMTMEYPLFDATSDFTVAPQPTAEKTEVVTGTVSYIQGTAPIVTYAGASDVSLQLLERSSPSYQDLLLQEYMRQWGLATNQAFVDILEAGATNDVLAYTQDAAGVEALLNKLFTLSTNVEAVTGLPANVVLAATDIFIALGGSSGVLPPPAYGTQNVGGTAQASTLSINVSGLNVIHEPQMTATHMIVGSSSAAQWHEDGPRIIDSLNVAQLGRDYAIYSFGAGEVFMPGAVYDVTVTVT